jgi:hypothetical protein
VLLNTSYLLHNQQLISATASKLSKFADKLKESLKEETASQF